MRSLGEEETPRDKTLQKALANGGPRWNYWNYNTINLRFEQDLIGIRSLLQQSPASFLSIKGPDPIADYKKLLIQEFMGVRPTITIIDEPMETDDGRDDATALPDLLQPRYTWREDGDA